MPETFFYLQAKTDKKMMRQKGERHMVMPTAPGPSLVMIHSQFRLAFFERRLDRPAQPGLAHQVGFSNPRRSITQIVFDLRPITRAAPKDNPNFVAGATAAFTHRTHKSEVGSDRAFGAFLYRISSPNSGRQ